MSRLCALLGLVLVLIGLFPAAARSQPDLRQLGGCVREHHTFSILLVLDRSESLDETDKSFERISAAKAVAFEVSSVLGRRLAGDEPVRVDMAVAAFADTFETAPWRSLPAQQDSVLADFDAYDNKDHGRDGKATDFTLVMNRAREVFAQRTAEVNGAPLCKAVLLFTDGEFDAVGTDDKAAEAALCAPGGPVDQLRASDITLAVGALTSGERKPDQALLRRMAGIDPGCGETPSPSGAYVPIAQNDDLVQELVKLVPVGTPPKLCRTERDCEFTLEPTMTTFTAIVRLGKTGAGLMLRPPRAQAVPLVPPGRTLAVAGTRLTTRWLDDNVIGLTAALPETAVGQWAGTWSLTTDGGATTLDARVFLLADLRPAIVGEPDLQRGKPWRMDLGVAGASALRPAGSLEPRFTVFFTDGTERLPASVTPAPGDSTRATVEFAAPASWHGTSVDVEVELRLKTSGGTDISPGPLIRRLPVRTLLDVTPKELVFGVINGREPARAPVTITATERAGCVRFDGVRINVRAVKVDTRVLGRDDQPVTGCLPVAANTSQTVWVRLAPEKGWDGTAKGELAMTVSEEGGPELPVSLAITAPMVAGVPAEDLIGAVLFAIGLGLIVPWVSARRLNYYMNAKVDTTYLRWATTEVVVAPSGGAPRYRTVGADTGWPAWRDTQAVPDTPRKLSLGRIRFRSVVLRRSPLSAPALRITADGDQVTTPEHGPDARIYASLEPDRLDGLVVARHLGSTDDGGFRAQIVIFTSESRTLTAERRAALRASITEALDRFPTPESTDSPN
ncbi:vWA domain-containing protein [Amycolatopsis sp. RTGN1]|uniref:vWA domain-containing protein n=1 Tax=Amycolatopsis ponsaeliensis TaxID=2992142 RepID=UPI00254EDED9|nr:vWA domain-containing protein [Amycolatopsis sp. RTGN1]